LPPTTSGLEMEWGEILVEWEEMEKQENRWSE